MSSSNPLGSNSDSNAPHLQQEGNIDVASSQHQQRATRTDGSRRYQPIAPRPPVVASGQQQSPGQQQVPREAAEQRQQQRQIQSSRSSSQVSEYLGQDEDVEDIFRRVIEDPTAYIEQQAQEFSRQQHLDQQAHQQEQRDESANDTHHQSQFSHSMAQIPRNIQSRELPADSHLSFPNATFFNDFQNHFLRQSIGPLTNNNHDMAQALKDFCRLYLQHLISSDWEGDSASKWIERQRELLINHMATVVQIHCNFNPVAPPVAPPTAPPTTNITPGARIFPMPSGRTEHQAMEELVEAMRDGGQFLDKKGTTPLKHWREMTDTDFERVARLILRNLQRFYSARNEEAVDSSTLEHRYQEIRRLCRICKGTVWRLSTPTLLENVIAKPTAMIARFKDNGKNNKKQKVQNADYKRLKESASPGTSSPLPSSPPGDCYSSSVSSSDGYESPPVRPAAKRQRVRGGRGRGRGAGSAVQSDAVAGPSQSRQRQEPAQTPASERTANSKKRKRQSKSTAAMPTTVESPVVLSSPILPAPRTLREGIMRGFGVSEEGRATGSASMANQDAQPQEPGNTPRQHAQFLQASTSSQSPVAQHQVLYSQQVDQGLGFVPEHEQAIFSTDFEHANIADQQLATPTMFESSHGQMTRQNSGNSHARVGATAFPQQSMLIPQVAPSLQGASTQQTPALAPGSQHTPARAFDQQAFRMEAEEITDEFIESILGPRGDEEGEVTGSAPLIDEQRQGTRSPPGHGFRLEHSAPYASLNPGTLETQTGSWDNAPAMQFPGLSSTPRNADDNQMAGNAATRENATEETSGILHHHELGSFVVDENSGMSSADLAMLLDAISGSSAQPITGEDQDATGQVDTEGLGNFSDLFDEFIDFEQGEESK